MFALLSIGWFISFVVSILVVFHFIGFSGLTNMFPEGKRGWHFPAQLVSLAFFALLVLYNPFITWGVRWIPSLIIFHKVQNEMNSRMKIGIMTAIIAATAGVAAAFPGSRRVLDPKPEQQSEEEALTALEKAQAKRDRKAAKRLKDSPEWTPEMFEKLDKLVKELDE